MKTFILILTIMNYNGIGSISADFDSYDNCMIAGEHVTEQIKQKHIVSVTFACVEK
jgi:hypothetical protein